MLIDIYEEQFVWVHSVWDKRTEKDECRICSKKFWFIKWLVEKDKIDLDYTYNLVKLEDKCYDGEWYYIESNYESYWAVDRTIMYLAISDNPIQDLISLLK